jgi:hypothetical protein
LIPLSDQAPFLRFEVGQAPFDLSHLLVGIEVSIAH